MLSFSYIWIFILLPLPWLVQRLSKPFAEERQAVRTPFFAEVVELLALDSGNGAIIRGRSWAQRLVLISVWILLVAALARPQWIEQPVVKEIASRDLLLAIDLSGSMETKDFTGKNGKNINRLAATKEVLDDFLSRRQGDRVGLIFFGTAPFIQVPFTEDLALCRELLKEAQVGMAGPRTALGDSIGLAINMFKESEVSDKVLILLTDGNDTSSKIAPVKAARIAAEHGIVLYTVAVGDPRAAGEEKLDEQTLKTMASTSNGSYFWAGNRSELEKIYKQIDALSAHDIESMSYRPKLDLFYYPLGLAILLSLLFHLAHLQEIWRRGN